MSERATAAGGAAGADRPADPGTRIGHVHLKAADLDRALDFYRGVLGFGLTQRYGARAAFVAAGDDHRAAVPPPSATASDAARAAGRLQTRQPFPPKLRGLCTFNGPPAWCTVW